MSTAAIWDVHSDSFDHARASVRLAEAGFFEDADLNNTFLDEILGVSYWNDDTTRKRKENIELDATVPGSLQMNNQSRPGNPPVVQEKPKDAAPRKATKVARKQILTPLEKRQRNREHAKKSRQRKKDLACVLERSVRELRTENLLLREKLYNAFGRKKGAEIIAMRQSHSIISFLQHPPNRMLDAATIGFINSFKPAACYSGKATSAQLHSKAKQIGEPCTEDN